MPSQTLSAPRASSSAGYIVLTGVFALLVLAAIGLIGIFHLSSESAILRQTVMNGVPGEWDKRIALRVGWITTSLVRCGSRFIHMPPEPRAALDAVRGGEVGVYHLREEPQSVDRGRILSQADRAMARRGWTRAVGVVQEHQLVAVYLPKSGISSKRVRACVAVLDGRDLVIVSARGNLEPLMGIVEKHLDHGPGRQLLAWR
jgi:hypothetical protein